MAMPRELPTESPSEGELLLEVAIQDIRQGANVRQSYDEENLNLLSQSIAKYGLRQPILVHRVAGELHLIDGYRRLMASLKAGLTRIMARVREGDCGAADKSLEQLVLNCQRENLNDVQLARALHDLKSTANMTGTRLAATLGLSHSKVSRLLELLELAPCLLTKVESGELAASVALEIHKRPESEQAEALAQYQRGEQSRDGLVASRNFSRRPAETPTRKVSRATANLGKDRSVSVAAPGLDLDGFIQLLQELLEKARKARPQGLALGTFLKVLRETSGGK